MDVFSKELLKGLPPLKGIEHQIDLVARATLPNRSAIRMNLEEVNELKHRVNELLEKEFVCTSLSHVLFLHCWCQRRMVVSTCV